MGGKVMSVVIDNDFKDELSEEVKAPADLDALTWMLYNVLGGGLFLGAFFMATDRCV